jgi:WD40 repeat protein
VSHALKHLLHVPLHHVCSSCYLICSANTDPFTKAVPDRLESRLQREGIEEDALCCAFNRRGTYLAVGCDTGKQKLFVIASFFVLLCMFKSTKHCSTMPSYRLLFATGDVIIWDFVLRSTARVITAHAGAVTGVAWSRRSRALLTASLDGHVHLWDLSGVSTDALTADKIAATSTVGTTAGVAAAEHTTHSSLAAPNEHDAADISAVNTANTAHSSSAMPSESSSNADTAAAPSSAISGTTTADTHASSDATIAADSSADAASAIPTAGVASTTTDSRSSVEHSSNTVNGSSSSSSKPHLQASPKLELKVCFNGVGVVTAALHPFAVPLAAAVLADGSCWLINTDTVSTTLHYTFLTHKRQLRC